MLLRIVFLFISHRRREKNVQCDEGGDDPSINRKKVLMFSVINFPLQ